MGVGPGTLSIFLLHNFVEAERLHYHPQELAFFSWFYRQRPSLGVNGRYSGKGKFRSPAKPC